MYNTRHSIFSLLKLIMSVITLTFLIANSHSADLNSILEGLNNYNKSYDNYSLLALTYRHISEKPPQTKEEAKRIAIQQIQFSSGSLFGNENSPNRDKLINEYIGKIDFNSIVNQIMQGSVMEQTIQILFRYNDFEHIVVDSDGSLRIDQKYDHNQSRLSVFVFNESKNSQYTDKALLNNRNPKQNIQFLFKWCSIFDADGILNVVQLDDNRFRISSKSDQAQLTLEVGKMENYFVPIKFVIDKENSYIETHMYKNYVSLKGLLVPSLIAIDIIPKKSSANFTAFLGQTRLLYSLE